MRSRSRPAGPRPVGLGVLIIAGLAATLAGCSSSGSQSSLTTSSLAPRPQQPVYGNAGRTYPDGSTYGRPYTVAPQRQAYAPRQYVDPGTPTPRHMAENGAYGGRPDIQTASIGPDGHRRPAPPRYDPNARWQQPSRIVTGSAAPTAQPQQAAPRPPHGPHVIQVREGDTLYSISRTHRVPLHDIVVANRLTSDRIEVGQRLVIPTDIR